MISIVKSDVTCKNGGEKKKKNIIVRARIDCHDEFGSPKGSGKNETETTHYYWR